MDVSGDVIFLETPPPHSPLETSRTFFDNLSWRLWELSVVYKGTLGTKPGADNEQHTYLKCWILYTLYR